ncbi:DNA-binding response regulator [Dictyobacter sp. S3.2.2.5]|uniref:DNA-binding response regulator n=1 Tax=Dictyobacter halimunensis TaxID=3026934 RepID=A0ABQ6FTL4_9CHLR|nr:DNA-binding response regulator [Dictyobacter sp. S3.2.2.5]
MTIRVLIADDHSVVREGLRMFLSRDPEIMIVGEAADGEEVVRMAGYIHPDVVLMDVLMPGMDGIAATSELRKLYPDTEVIALTSVLERTTVVDVIKAGAIGYLLKDTQALELRKAIKAAAAGQIQISPQASATLVQHIQSPTPTAALTERETEVLRLLAQGASNKEIAQHLDIAEVTTKVHVRHILAKLGVQSRTQAVLCAVNLGLVSLDSTRK